MNAKVIAFGSHTGGQRRERVVFRARYNYIFCIHKTVFSMRKKPFFYLTVYKNPIIPLMSTPSDGVDTL